jgi:hypothetical protein
MTTRILEGRRINENNKSGACFYDATTGRAFGPIFQDEEEAERFVQFLAGIDPRNIDWSQDFHTSPYRVWLACDKVAQRPAVQFSIKDCSEADPRHPEGDGHTLWAFNLSLVEHCFPLFNGWSNHDVCKQLEKDDVLRRTPNTNPLRNEENYNVEHSCLYCYFDTKDLAEGFLSRLNEWLCKNWHRAYPKGAK